MLDKKSINFKDQFELQMKYGQASRKSLQFQNKI